MISGNLFCQTNYTITQNSSIYDLPNGDFLTAIALNDSTFIKHYDFSGNLIWENYLTFNTANTQVRFNKISRFKNTDEYLINSYYDPTPSTSHWSGFTNDTLVYQFTKLNLTNHVFSSSVIDTFSCAGISLVEMKDTSIYLMVSDKSLNNSPFNHATYSINQFMEVSLIAPLDSIIVYPYGGTYNVFGDSIYHHQELAGTHFMKKYSTSMSKLDSTGTVITTNQYFNSTCYKQFVNDDSLFVFTKGSTPGSYAEKWRMDWRNSDLTQIATTEISAPLFEDGPLNLLRYTTNFGMVAIDKMNKNIVVLAEKYGSSQQNTDQKIFIYDYNFNLICEGPVTFDNSDQNRLIELNNRVYLKANTELFLVDCQSIGIEQLLMVTNDHIVYPNPASNELNITSSSEINNIELFELNGRKINEFNVNNNNISIDISNLNTGMYILHITSGSQKFIKRILKK